MTNKWLVIGQLGSGKTTFSRKLAMSIDGAAVHLDELIWDSGWEEVSNAVLQQRVSEKIGKSSHYVTEGVLVDKLSPDLPRFYDGIIFLDIPFYLCFFRATRRNFIRVFTREKICGDNRESIFSFVYTMFGMTFKHRSRQSKFYDLTEKFKTAGQESMVFQNNNQANSWLMTIQDKTRA